MDFIFNGDYPQTETVSIVTASNSYSVRANLTAERMYLLIKDVSCRNQTKRRKNRMTEQPIAPIPHQIQ